MLLKVDKQSSLYLTLGHMCTFNGFFITTVNSCLSDKSTSPPSTAFHSKHQIRFAIKYSKWSIGKPSPGQILLPTPKGIILIPLLPVISNTLSPLLSPLRNLSGLYRNSSYFLVECRQRHTLYALRRYEGNILQKWEEILAFLFVWKSQVYCNSRWF